MEHFYDRIPGWFDYDSIYSRMVREAPSTAHFVEVGVYYGRSAAYMIAEIANSGKSIEFDCVDPDPRFLPNLSEVQDRYRAIINSSPAAAEPYGNETLDFVWLDGDHSDEGILADIEAWLPKVRVGGWLGGHDYKHPMHPGIEAACHALLPGHLEIPPTGDSPMVSSFLWQKT